MSIIEKKRGIVIALDVTDVDSAVELARQLCGLEGNFVFKIGRPLEMQRGYKVISEIKKVSRIPVVYDGKIADIPYISSRIAQIAYEAGADAVIVHGFVGRDVIESILELNRGDVIVVMSMTHPGASQYINPITKQLVETVNTLGVDGVVLPATKPEIIASVAPALRENIYIMSPGIKVQGARVGDAIKTGADYEIIGRAIYGASDPKKAAEELYKEILEV